MVYKIIPLPSDVPSQSQAALLENFNQLNNQFGTEHTALTAGALNGQHNFVTLQPKTPPFAPVPAAGQAIVYNSNTATNVNNRFIGVRRPGQDYDVPVCITVLHKAIGALGGTYNLFSFNPTTHGSLAGYVIVYDESFYRRTIMSPFVYEATVGVNGTVSVPDYHVGGQLVSDVGTGGPWQGVENVLNSINLNKSATGAATNVTIKIVGSAI